MDEKDSFAAPVRNLIEHQAHLVFPDLPIPFSRLFAGEDDTWINASRLQPLRNRIAPLNQQLHERQAPTSLLAVVQGSLKSAIDANNMRCKLYSLFKLQESRDRYLSPEVVDGADFSARVTAQLVFKDDVATIKASHEDLQKFLCLVA